MPQASDETRAKIKALFEHKTHEHLDWFDTYFSEEYIRERGFYVDKQWCIYPPATPCTDDSAWDCVDFLLNEWDYAYENKPYQGLRRE